MASNMHTMPDIQVNTDVSNVIRFPAWLLLAICSAISLTAACSALPANKRGSEEKFVVAVCSISMAVAGLACCGYLVARHLILGTMIELGMMVVVLVFWGIGLFYIMDPDNGIAVLAGAVVNANLYFFSWASFAVVVFLFHSYVQETLGIDARSAPGKESRWFFFLVSSMVVMGVSVRLYTSETGCNADNHTQKYCRRTTYGIALGTISCFTAMIVIYFLTKGITLGILDLGITTILIIMWTFGVAYFTFGDVDDSPGTFIGNLFFSTWFSFLLAAMLFGHSIQEFMGMQSPSAAAAANNNNNTSGDRNVGATTDPHEEDF